MQEGSDGLHLAVKVGLIILGAGIALGFYTMAKKSGTDTVTKIQDSGTKVVEKELQKLDD